MIREHIRRCELAVFLLSVVFLFSKHVPAQAHSDVFLSRVGGQVAIGGANELGTVEESYDLTTRLFEGVMIPDFPPFSPADYGRDEPGILALASGSPAMPAGASALPGSVPVTISFPSFSVEGNIDSLFYWNGSGAVNFQPIATSQPGVGFSLDANPIGSTEADGSLHVHAAFQLDNGTSGVPSDGVYVIAPTASVPGLATSERFYMVWLVDALIADDEAAEEVEEAFEAGTFEVLGKDFSYFEEAAQYVHDNLVVPEPASGLLSYVALAGIAMASRRRRGRREAER
jgi:hypothetical protein